jgi:hypothetical protein
MMIKITTRPELAPEYEYDYIYIQLSRGEKMMYWLVVGQTLVFDQDDPTPTRVIYFESCIQFLH